MTVIKSPFRSELGFASPNFLVTESGNIVTSGNIAIDGDFTTAGDIKSEGSITIDGDVEVNGNLITPNNIVSNAIIVKGISIVDSENNTFKINNQITRSNLKKLGVLEILEVFGDVSIKSEDSSEVLTIINGQVTINSQTTGSLDNINIGLTTPAEAVFTEIEVDDVKINNTPTELFHATRKDYVDTTAAALAIALGA